MNAKKESALTIAERAFQEAVRNACPADLIKILYDDLIKERRKVRR